MDTQYYKVVRNNAHEISGWKIPFILKQKLYFHIGVRNGDVQFESITLTFKQWEQLKDFHRKILILQQGIKLFGETVSTTRIILQRMKEFNNCDKAKAFIETKTIELITHLNKNGKPVFKTVVNIYDINCYVKIIDWIPN